MHTYIHTYETMHANMHYLYTCMHAFICCGFVASSWNEEEKKKPHGRQTMLCTFGGGMIRSEAIMWIYMHACIHKESKKQKQKKRKHAELNTNVK
jgi:hypothetical protein